MPFEKGKSGNPGGRAKIVLANGMSLRDLCRAHTEEAIRTLVEIMKASTSDQAKTAAANSLLDRGWGKPTQPISGDDTAPPIQHEMIDPKKLSETTLREIAAAGTGDPANLH